MIFHRSRLEDCDKQDVIIYSLLCSGSLPFEQHNSLPTGSRIAGFPSKMSGITDPGNIGEEYFNQVCGSLLNFKKSS